MTDLLTEAWHVVGCGNPEHGPAWTCWKVKDERGRVVLSGVHKAAADRYAAIPDMARALIGLRRVDRALLCWCEPSRDIVAGHDARCRAVFAALDKAGMHLP